MKNIFKSIAVLFLIFNCFVITAQTKKEHLVGTWFFDYETSMSKMEGKAKAHYETMPVAFKTKFEKTYKGRKLSFNADGGFLQQTADGKQMSGAWLIDDDNQNIRMTNSQGFTIELKIEILSAVMLVLKPENKENGQMMLSEWNFIKN